MCVKRQIDSYTEDLFYKLAMLTLSLGMIVFAYTFSSLYKVIIVCIDLMFLAIMGFKLKIECYHIALALFIAWAGLSLFWNNYDVDTMVFPTFMYCIITAIILHNVLDRESRYIILQKCIIISACSLGLVMIHNFGLSEMLSARVTNEVLNTNRAGTIFAVAMYFCIYLFYKEKSKIYLVISAYLFFMALVSGSKSALIIATVSMFVMILFKNGKYYKKLLRNIFIVTILFVIVMAMIIRIPTLYNVIGARFIEFVEVMTGRRQVLVGEHSMYMRITLSQFGLKGFVQSPIWGHGLDSFRYSPGNPWPGRYSHMNYIELMYNLGIIGLIFYYTPFFIMIIHFRVVKNNLDSLTRAFLLGFIVYYALYGVMGIFFNELFEWLILEMMCSFILMKHSGQIVDYQFRAE